MSVTRPSYYAGQMTCPECGKKIRIDLIALALATAMSGLELLICRYVTRWKSKAGLQDLLKARECLDRLIEQAESDLVPALSIGSEDVDPVVAIQRHGEPEVTL